MKRPRIYISGPITGTTDYIERFDMATYVVYGLGYTPVNPTTMFGWFQPFFSIMPYRFQVFIDCMVLAFFCKAIYLMKDYETSRGACLEKAVADFCQKEKVLAGSPSEKPLTKTISAIQELGNAMKKIYE